MSQRHCNAHGFTLMELLVVMAIIGVLAAILFPVLGVARQKAMVSKVQQELKGLELAIQDYQMDHGSFPAPTDPSWTNKTYPYYIKQLVDANEITLGEAKKFVDPFSNPDWELYKRYYHYYVAKKDQWTYVDGNGDTVGYPSNDSFIIFSVGPDEDGFTFLKDNGDVDTDTKPEPIRVVFSPEYLDQNNDSINDFEYSGATYRYVKVPVPDPPALEPFNGKHLPNNPKNAFVLANVGSMDVERADGIILEIAP